MIENLAGSGPEAGLPVLAITLAAGLALTGLLRTYIGHRTRLQVEREVSARTAARTTGLVRLAGTQHEAVSIDEQDRDGHRVVELRSRLPQSGEEAA